jgi:uncharacterized protein
MSLDQYIDVVAVEGRDLPAGRFEKWLAQITSALTSQQEMDVPCGECNACCRSSFFIHIAPTETETLEHIPKALVFAAPGLPEGFVLMGFDEKGCCPMLKDDQCSIYEYRPSACRVFDCRIYPAAATVPPKRIAVQSGRWRFDANEPGEADALAALQRAARFLAANLDCFPTEVPNSGTGLALAAVRVTGLFQHDELPTGQALGNFIQDVRDKLQG